MAKQLDSKPDAEDMKEKSEDSKPRMDKNPMDEFPDLKKFVESNKMCADCDCASDLTWAETTHGILLCIKCCGVHRSLGTHISTCRSVTMDKWTDELISKLNSNEKINELYEYNVPKEYLKPRFYSERKLRENYIKAKYGANTKDNKPLFHKNNQEKDSKPNKPIYDPDGIKKKGQYGNQQNNETNKGNMLYIFIFESIWYMYNIHKYSHIKTCLKYKYIYICFRINQISSHNCTFTIYDLMVYVKHP